MSTRRIVRIALVIIWLIGAASALLAWRASGVPLVELPQAMAEWLERFGRINAVCLFLSLYALRPLVLFPSSIFTLSAGLLFGPWVGFAVALVGENAGANLAFTLSRVIGRDLVRRRIRGFFERVDQRLAEHGIRYVAIFRLIHLPFDTVSFGCGVTSVKARHFALGTLLGSIPYLFSFALLGGAGSAQLGHTLTILGMTLTDRALSLALGGLGIAIGLVLAWSLRRRHRDIATLEG